MIFPGLVYVVPCSCDAGRGSEPHFWIMLFVLGFLSLLLISISCFYVLEIKPMLFAEFAVIFSQFIGCPFILLLSPFVVQKFMFD